MKTVLIGNVLDKLKEIQDSSIDCIVTSPPYFALRDYGTPHQTWGGFQNVRMIGKR